MKHNCYPLIICITLALPMLAHADNLTCIPETMCIDEDCQAGKDDRLAVVLHDWTSAHAMLTSDYGKVTMTRAKRDGRQQWTGVNAEGQTETLILRGAKMNYTHTVQLEPTSAVGTLTAKGHCKVTK